MRNVPVWFKVDSLAFKTVIVSNIVGILFLEFVVCGVGKGLSPKDHGLIHTQSNALQKQAILKSASVLEMLVSSQGIVQIAHTQGCMVMNKLNIKENEHQRMVCRHEEIPLLNRPPGL